jgi:hypothetical protein
METEYEQRRRRLVRLVDRHFARDNDLVAGIIELKTGAKVSERTVQAWLIASGRKSSRNCPEWAVKALEDYAADPANRQRLEDCAARLEASLNVVTGPLAWSDEVRRNKAVEFATSALESDARNLRLWQDAGGLHLGKLLFELEHRLNSEMHAHAGTLTAIREAFRTSSTYDECKAKFEEHDRASDLNRYFVRDARRAIENSSEEFAAFDAVMQQPTKTEAK